MSWNHSKKSVEIKCPECGAPGLRVTDPNYEWRCMVCETVGPDFEGRW